MPRDSIVRQDEASRLGRRLTHGWTAARASGTVASTWNLVDSGRWNASVTKSG